MDKWEFRQQRQCCVNDVTYNVSCCLIRNMTRKEEYGMIVETLFSTEDVGLFILFHFIINFYYLHIIHIDQTDIRYSSPFSWYHYCFLGNGSLQASLGMQHDDILRLRINQPFLRYVQKTGNDIFCLSTTPFSILSKNNKWIFCFISCFIIWFNTYINTTFRSLKSSINISFFNTDLYIFIYSGRNCIYIFINRLQYM